MSAVRRVVGSVLGPLWVTAFRDPVREGRLRLDALSRVERQLARGGLVLLGVLLASMLFAAAWRASDLLAVGGGLNTQALVPDGVVGLTLLALFVAWCLLTWGAIDAAPSVRLLVAVVFVLSLVGLDRIDFVLDDGPWITRHGPGLIHAAFLTVPGALVVSALVSPVERIRRPVDVGLRVVVLLALATFLLGPLWIHAELVAAGSTSQLPSAVDAVVYNLNGVALPLAIVAAVVVVDLALDVSTSLAEPARRLSARWALALLLAVVAAKLVFQVARQLPVWADLLQNQPLAVARTVGSLALLAGLVVVATRVRRTDAFAEAKERVIYLGAFVIAAPFLLGNALFQLGNVGTVELDDRRLFDLAARVPLDPISQWFPLVASVLLVGLGIVMMRRSRGGYGDELGSAIVVVAGWNVPVSVVSGFQIPVAFSYLAVDPILTLAVLAAVLVTWARRRTVPAATSVTLAAALVFTWLVTSRGDYISFAGGLLGLSSVLVVVVGVLYGLASDSAFASEASKRLPADARPMLYVGFLLVSVTLLHWVEVTHETDDFQVAGIGFFRIGIPLAGWYLGRRLLGLGDAESLQPSHDAAASTPARDIARPASGEALGVLPSQVVPPGDG